MCLGITFQVVACACALTHVHFALNLLHTTLNTHPLSTHIPSALTQLTDTAHSQLTHRALTQRTHDLRCRVIRDERQLALGVHCLATVCTHPLCTHPPCCRKKRSIRSFSLSVHSPNVVSIYSPAVCTHPLPSQRLSHHQWTLTKRTEHRHSSLKQRAPFRCLCIS